MKFLFFIYLCTPLIHAEKDEGRTPSLHYKKTIRESMSKYQRINYIEHYLGDLETTIKKMNDQERGKRVKEETALKEKVTALETKVQALEKKIKELEKNINPPTKEE